jgi:two-component system, cell cycle sensor histidine kinase and response regulator CckA
LPLPFWEHRSIKQPVAGFLPRTVPRHISFMSAANPIPWPVSSEPVPSQEERAAYTFHSFFGNAPISVACCNREGLIVAMNAAFQHRFGGLTSPMRFRDLVSQEKRDEADFLLHELIESRRDTVELPMKGAGGEGTANWIAWRPEFCGKSEPAMMVAETGPVGEGCAESLLQAQRWEAIGRLTGGVVHDFNNLLTGVMLYCDLLLSGLDQHDLRRRYAEGIRAAIVPASGLVRQLLVFARPEHDILYPVSFTEIAESMRDLLIRLVGENISLELRLDAQLGPVKMARSQAQQVLLNLVLNARDAMPEGGRICIATSKGSFQPITSAASNISNVCLPCVLLTVTDNGHGMDGETRRRLFEPFFTTKAEKASGLGLTTVQSIVTSHRGLIHFESEPGIGTCAMILLPRADEWVDSDHSELAETSLRITSALPLQEVKRESLL